MPIMLRHFETRKTSNPTLFLHLKQKISPTSFMWISNIYLKIMVATFKHNSRLPKETTTPKSIVILDMVKKNVPCHKNTLSHYIKC
jgi:hypothetical protein